MGAIGNKPKKFRTAETYDEPEMLADLDSIRKKAMLMAINLTWRNSSRTSIQISKS